FAHSVINELEPEIRVLPGSLAARKLLVARVLEYLNHLDSEGAGRGALQREIAMAYYSIANIQGGTMIANTGDSAGALVSLEKARDLILSLPYKAEILAWSSLANVYGQIAAIRVSTRHYGQALENAERSLFYCNAILQKSA